MVRINNPVFQNRVILGEYNQKKLLKAHSMLFDTKAEASKSLGLNSTTYSAYCRFQNKSLPTDIFWKIVRDFKTRKWFTFIDKERISNDFGYRKQILKQYKRIWGSTKRASQMLGIHKDTYHRYENGVSKKIPDTTLENIVTALDGFSPFGGLDFQSLILEEISLENLRREAIKKWRHDNPEKALKNSLGGLEKAVVAIKKKYGENWKYEITKTARKALLKEYGDDAYKKLGKIAIKKVKEKYGENAPSVFGAQGIKKLKEKYGEDYVQKKLRAGLIEKFGDDWAFKIKELRIKAAKEKYGENWRYEITKPAREQFLKKYGKSGFSLIGTLGGLKAKGVNISNVPETVKIWEDARDFIIPIYKSRWFRNKSLTLRELHSRTKDIFSKKELEEILRNFLLFREIPFREPLYEIRPPMYDIERYINLTILQIRIMEIAKSNKNL